MTGELSDAIWTFGHQLRSRSGRSQTCLWEDGNEPGKPIGTNRPAQNTMTYKRLALHLTLSSQTTHTATAGGTNRDGLTKDGTKINS